MVEPDSLVLEQVRVIGGDIGKLLSEMQTNRVEMTAMRRHMTGMMIIQEHDHVDIAGIKNRLEAHRKASRTGGLSQG